jgi:hypothetical protein
LARVGRWVLGGLLLVVLVLFLASGLGWLQIGSRRPPAQPAVQTLVSWEMSPGQAGPEGSRLSSAGAGDAQTLAKRVLGWATETLAQESLRSAATPSGSDQRLEAPGSAAGEMRQVRVFLANGCGVNRLAASLCQQLRAAGFDVCGVGNADRSNYSETLVVDRCGTLSEADAVCAFFRERFGVGRVLRQARRAPVADVLVVLGHDLADCQRPGESSER